MNATPCQEEEHDPTNAECRCFRSGAHLPATRHGTPTLHRGHTFLTAPTVDGRLIIQGQMAHGRVQRIVPPARLIWALDDMLDQGVVGVRPR